MAEYHHTSEPGPAKVKYPLHRHLTVQETLCESPVTGCGIEVNYMLVNLEPCVVLRGKWLRKAGFATGQKIDVIVNQGEVVITPQAAGLKQAAEN
ncbi:SymE family type I addiction module toxin [Thalassomonas haliotis]|uniref:Type I addiction module toxin, SymE family n=1 Tax=Thalassomonas haliotis TaxID=485448 RepID=A0ABY7VCC2_9GAMM|nr:SymE family type I addiction module toxin [Thalassomonas haliotis]WDE11315.1 type I addiction module toxin, SymE family [Thalassomonas haliotis]